MRKRWRCLAALASVVFVMAATVLSAAADVAMWTEDYYAPPFKLTLQTRLKNSYIGAGVSEITWNPQTGYFPFFSDPYDFPGDYDGSTEVVSYTGTVEHEYGSDDFALEVSNSVLGRYDSWGYLNDWGLKSSISSGGELYVTRTCLEQSFVSSVNGMESAGFIYDPTSYVYLTDTYLDKDCTLLVDHDGYDHGAQFSCFALYDYFGLLLSERGTDTVRVSVTGSFYLLGDRTAYTCAYDDLSSLSYWRVLYGSNVENKAIELLPEDKNVDIWQMYYEEFAEYDWVELTEDQIEKLEYCYGHLGSIYGDFEFEIDYRNFNSMLESQYEQGFLIKYVLRDKDYFADQYARNVRVSVENSYSGFERVTHFLGSAVSGFLNVEIMPNFSLAGILMIIITFSIVLWWLKVFAGG